MLDILMMEMQFLLLLDKLNIHYYSILILILYNSLIIIHGNKTT